MNILPRSAIAPATWDAFCAAHPGAWFLWTSAYLDYQAARGARELSFGIMDADRLVAICPLFLEERDGVRSFTMEGHPGLWPLGGDDNGFWNPFAIFECLAIRESVTREAYMMSPLGWPDLPFANRPDTDWHSQIVDLTQSEAALHAGLRKSYTALINKAERTHRIFVDETGDALAGFRVAHWFKAGRFTRPPETWAMQQQWIRDGHALHVCATLAGGLDASAFFIVYKRAACYASAVQLNPNVHHALVWRAMVELKARGVEKLEMGWQGYATDEKGKQIEFYKRGFGGQAVPIVAVERRW